MNGIDFFIDCKNDFQVDEIRIFHQQPQNRKKIL